MTAIPPRFREGAKWDIKACLLDLIRFADFGKRDMCFFKPRPEMQVISKRVK